MGRLGDGEVGGMGRLEGWGGWRMGRLEGWGGWRDGEVGGCGRLEGWGGWRDVGGWRDGEVGGMGRLGDGEVGWGNGSVTRQISRPGGCQGNQPNHMKATSFTQFLKPHGL